MKVASARPAMTSGSEHRALHRAWAPGKPAPTADRVAVGSLSSGFRTFTLRETAAPQRLIRVASSPHNSQPLAGQRQIAGLATSTLDRSPHDDVRTKEDAGHAGSPIHHH